MAMGSFATALGCIDGRATIPTTNFLKHLLHVDFIDFVSAPGPDKVLLQASPAEVEVIKQSLLVSVNAHHSQAIAIAAHHGCAGNPVSREEHLAAVQQCARLVQSSYLGVRVVGLWVNDQWQVEIVCDTAEQLRKSA